jgi:hypothetical protein
MIESWNTNGMSGLTLGFCVTNRLTQVVARFGSRAEAQAMADWRGGQVATCCSERACPQATECVGNLNDGLGFRDLCFDHAFSRGSRVGSDSELLVSA